MEEQKKEKYSLVQVPTQHQIAVETPKGEVITIESLMVEIANRMTIMEKALTLMIPNK